MRTIFKYTVDSPSTDMLMPDGAVVLDVQPQDGRLAMWALVDTTEPLVERTVSVYGTGHQVPEDAGAHIGTAQVDGFVWHLFMDDR